MSCLDREPLATKLRAATERIKMLEAVTNDPHALWANWLRGSVALPVGIGDVRQYQERIKRLEEAGDAMDPMNDSECECDSGYVVVCKHCFDRSEKWRKAKEAKP